MRALQNTLLRAALLMAIAVSPALAESYTGTVTNGSTGKPAAGITVTLVDPMGGMAEVATAKTDASGHYTLKADAGKGPRLVRAEMGGVNYFKMMSPGAAGADIEVFEAAKNVDGISGSADVVKMQADGSRLDAVELFAVKNESKPPRTLASDATFEFVLPEGAVLDGAEAQGPNGQPVQSTASPAKEKNHYTFSYALKPGETRLQVVYHVAYSGQLAIRPQLTTNFDHYVLVLPAAMSFKANDASQFKPMNNQPGSTVQVSLKAKAGQDLSYTVTGTGTIPDEQEQAGGAAPSGEDAAASNRPGGGLGKPIESPDPLENSRWPLLVIMVALLCGGGVWTHERTRAMRAAAQPESAPEAAPVANGSALLMALKDELFQLELERQQGKLSAEEYDKARAALEQTLQRALARSQS